MFLLALCTACRNGEVWCPTRPATQVFEMAMVMDDSVSTHYPLLKIPARSKLSSLCWNGYIKSSLICADYDGVIQLWDIASASDVMQFDEHSRRVWSVDFSQVCIRPLSPRPEPVCNSRSRSQVLRTDAPDRKFLERPEQEVACSSSCCHYHRRLAAVLIRKSGDSFVCKLPLRHCSILMGL